MTDGTGGVTRVGVDVVSGGARARRHDLVAVEGPLQLRLVFGAAEARAELDLAVTMRTPGDDVDLALGFLHGEGLIGSAAQVETVDAADDIVTVTLDPGVAFDPASLTRNTYATSSCGVCGKASVEAVRVRIPTRYATDSFTVGPTTLAGLPAALRDQQSAFALTGGVHASAAFTADGAIERVAEDVGRHNALDKLIGAYLQAGELPLAERGLLFSGRASFELIQKAAMAGCPFVAAIGPPSSLAVELALEQRLTLVGFLREARFNIYTLPHRVVGDA